MMNKSLMKIVVENCIFFELIDEEVLIDDIAIQQLENISYYLEELDENGKNDFILFCKDYAKTTDSIEKKEVILQLPDSLGLLESKKSAKKSAS